MSIKRLLFASVATSVVFLSGAGSLVTAQVAPAQLEVLRGLSPTDRTALFDQLGLDGSVTPVGDGQTVNREDNAAAQHKKIIDSEFARPNVMGPGDSVLINIDFKRDKPARVISSGETGAAVVQPAEPAPTMM